MLTHDQVRALLLLDAKGDNGVFSRRDQNDILQLGRVGLAEDFALSASGKDAVFNILNADQPREATVPADVYLLYEQDWTSHSRGQDDPPIRLIGVYANSDHIHDYIKAQSDSWMKEHSSLVMVDFPNKLPPGSPRPRRRFYDLNKIDGGSTHTIPKTRHWVRWVIDRVPTTGPLPRE